MLGTVVVPALLWLFLVDPGTAAAQNREAFKKGIEAIDLERFDQAVPSLRQAIREDGRESEERVFLSGVFSRPYLPHFFLGWALYHQADEGGGSGEQQCEEALVALAESERQGVIAGFGRLHADLGTAKKACTGRLLPSVEAEARKEVERADELAAQLGPALPDRTSEADRQRLLGQLGDVRERLGTARAAGDPLAIGRATGELATVADGLESLVRTRDRLAEARDANAFSAASGAARDAIADAARDQRRLLDLLDDPQHGALRRRTLGTEPESAAADLAAARQQLAAATTVDQAQAAESRAREADGRFGRLVERATALVAAPVAAPASTETRPTPPPSRDITPPPPSPPSLDPGLVRDLRTRITAASDLLRTLRDRGELEGASRLVAMQSERLEAGIDAAEAWASGTGSGRAADDRRRHGELVRRLEGSSDALGLLVGTQRLFAGDPRGALGLLEAMEVDDEPAVGAQLHLLRAASHFELYRLGGELDLDRRQRATEAARRCHRLDPGLVPDPTPFSPAFRDFFAQAVASSEAASPNQNR